MAGAIMRLKLSVLSLCLLCYVFSIDGAYFDFDKFGTYKTCLNGRNSCLSSTGIYIEKNALKAKIKNQIYQLGEIRIAETGCITKNQNFENSAVFLVSGSSKQKNSIENECSFTTSQNIQSFCDGGARAVIIDEDGSLDGSNSLQYGKYSFQKCQVIMLDKNLSFYLRKHLEEGYKNNQVLGKNSNNIPLMIGDKPITFRQNHIYQNLIIMQKINQDNIWLKKRQDFIPPKETYDTSYFVENEKIDDDAGEGLMIVFGVVSLMYIGLWLLSGYLQEEGQFIESADNTSTDETIQDTQTDINRAVQSTRNLNSPIDKGLLKLIPIIKIEHLQNYNDSNEKCEKSVHFELDEKGSEEEIENFITTTSVIPNNDTVYYDYILAERISEQVINNKKKIFYSTISSSNCSICLEPFFCSKRKKKSCSSSFLKNTKDLISCKLLKSISNPARHRYEACRTFDTYSTRGSSSSRNSAVNTSLEEDPSEYIAFRRDRRESSVTLINSDKSSFEQGWFRGMPTSEKDSLSPEDIKDEPSEQDQKNQMLRLLPCGHVFHMECIDYWLLNGTSKASCPICKKRVIQSLFELIEATSAEGSLDENDLGKTKNNATLVDCAEKSEYFYDFCIENLENWPFTKLVMALMLRKITYGAKKTASFTAGKGRTAVRILRNSIINPRNTASNLNNSSDLQFENGTHTNTDSVIGCEDVSYYPVRRISRKYKQSNCRLDGYNELFQTGQPEIKLESVKRKDQGIKGKLKSRTKSSLHPDKPQNSSFMLSFILDKIEYSNDEHKGMNMGLETGTSGTADYSVTDCNLNLNECNFSIDIDDVYVGTRVRSQLRPISEIKKLPTSSTFQNS
ncbi:hypothetical protein BB560_001421 [Smittium megazygosporum]|uniref:RING-type domain-containing protein n=1 Tax=Smittium megazygosporum TaxID=133381 RepID=A0A2T9ZHP3_9FUNG|nr:hypothetical protein BB560_001421 [Smittium megazygosporum]